MTASGSAGTLSDLRVLFATENDSYFPRFAYIHITAGRLHMVIVVEQTGLDFEGVGREGELFPGIGTLPCTWTYVGAFWRANQRGERVIRVHLNSAYYGEWEARIAWADDNWSLPNDYIKLASGGSLDPNIYTENPGNPENESFWGAITHDRASGTVDKNNQFINFRIRLDQHFTAYHEINRPARYAVIILTYAIKRNAQNQIYKSKQHKIFLRQGEGADFVMAPPDGGKNYKAKPPNRPEQVPLRLYQGVQTEFTRTGARKFSPFNLTSPTLPIPPAGTQLSLRGGAFTQYPTQVGAFFKFADDDAGRMRRAYPPQGMVTGNTNTPQPNFWGMPTASPLSGIHETCPPGYRRPNDGTIIGLTTATAQWREQTMASEMRHSLFINPQGTAHAYATYTASNTDNSEWGYYADGFYDRRPIAPKNEQHLGTWEYKGQVSSGANVAFAGRIFFNDLYESGHYNASLFFPAAGYRNHTVNTTGPSPGLVNAGEQGNYMSTTRWNTGNYRTWNLRFKTGYSRMFYGESNINELLCIRCVRE